jgi:hypothetical protein
VSRPRNEDIGAGDQPARDTRLALGRRQSDDVRAFAAEFSRPLVAVVEQAVRLGLEAMRATAKPPPLPPDDVRPYRAGRSPRVLDRDGRHAAQRDAASGLPSDDSPAETPAVAVDLSDGAGRRVSPARVIEPARPVTSPTRVRFLNRDAFLHAPKEPTP